MKLSVVIVNYNVQFFLQQCLVSVFKATEMLVQQNADFTTEVFVVDNHSVDGSLRMLKNEFPQVKLIENTENVGFSKANNQAFEKAKGEYILALNPDTLIEEDTFVKVIRFLDENVHVGALGPKMIDGNGDFLAESKRSLPTPWVAFYKIFGLSALFQKSKKFGKYHLSYLPEDETNYVDVLAGAFMFMRKSVLDEIGFFDERFFMYGEDIDLSYRILLSGNKNVYFPETTVIHYKGESTKKGSLNYVYIFYKAMKLFADKHFSKKYAKWYRRIIDLAIYFRAIVSAIRRILLAGILPLIDFVLIFCIFWFSAEFWEVFKWSNPNYFPEVFKKEMIPIYSLIIIMGLFMKRNYKKVFKLNELLSGILLGGSFLIISYAFLNENLRFSRAVLLLGFGLSLLFLPLFRFILSKASRGYFHFYKQMPAKAFIVGSSDEILATENLLKKVDSKLEIAAYVSNEYSNPKVVGDLNHIIELVEVYKPNELIFCSGTYSSSEIIKTIHLLADKDLQFKISNSTNQAIIGSNQVYSSANLLNLQADSLAKPIFRIQKRVFDFWVVVVLFIFSPIIVFFQKDVYLFRNIWDVFLGKKTWVGISKKQQEEFEIDYIKLGIIKITAKLDEKMTRKELEENYLFYSKNYKLLSDLFIIFRAFNELGCKK